MKKGVWIIFAAGVGLNLAWEGLHVALYSNYLGGSITPIILLSAALCDGLIIAGLFLVAAKFKLNKNFFVIVGGLLIAGAIEIFAINTSWWSYNSAMPVVPVLDIGFSPLTQLAITGWLSLQIQKLI